MQMNKTILRLVLHYGCNGSSMATGNVYRMSFDAALSLTAALPDLSKVIRHVPNDHYAPIVKSQCICFESHFRITRFS